MGSYLANVKEELEDRFGRFFDDLWKDVIEPQLKESYRNGVEAGKSGRNQSSGDGVNPPSRRRFKRRRREQVEP